MMASWEAPPQKESTPWEVKPQFGNLPGGRRPSCLPQVVAFMLFVAVCLAAWFWRETWLPPVRTAVERLLDRFSGGDRRPQDAAQDEKDDPLARLRVGLSDIRDRIENFAESEELTQRLEALRTEIGERRDKTTQTLRKNWDDLVAKSDEIVRVVKEKGQVAPKQIDELLRGLRILEKLEREVKSKPAQEAQSLPTAQETP